MSTDELEFEKSLVRPYVMRHARPTPFAVPAGAATVPTRERLDQRPRVVLVAWGVDQAFVMHAIHRARERALDDDLAIVDWFAGYGSPMRATPLVNQADRFARRYEIDYDFAWWLVADWVIPPEELAEAQARQRETWSDEAGLGREGTLYGNPPGGWYGSSYGEPYGPDALRPVRFNPPNAAP